jgi:hypothetical protein
MIGAAAYPVAGATGQDAALEGEGGMNPGSWIAATALAALAAGGTALAQPAGGTFSVRNDTNRVMTCAVRKAGSSVSDLVVLKPDAEWRQTYAKAKPRNFRCEDSAPVWYLIKSGIRYRLAPTRHGLIVLAPVG